MGDVTRLFGARADAYASFRPHYPDALFGWLASHSPARQRALDIACGNGQASRPLRQHFEQVLACDSSTEQLGAAEDVAGIGLFVANAEALPLSDSSLDLIVVAQALHWFATPRFFAEARRLLKPDGLFCAWCYGLTRIDPQIDALIDQLYWDTLGGYWPTGRASVDAGYRDITNPFTPVTPPPAAMSAQWSPQQLLGYLRTWSAVQRYEQRHGVDPIAQLEAELRHAWPDAGQLRTVHWPLHFLAGTVS